MTTIGVGVVGCGFVGRGAHVPAISTIDNARLVAIADADEKRRNKVVKKYGPDAAYSDYNELIADPNVEAVIVSLPTHLHAKATLAAIAAGKHVLCEMPLAANMDEVNQIVQAANDAEVFMMPSLTFRFTPNYVKAKQMIEQGKLGNLSAVMYREFIPAKDLAGQWPPDAWVWNVKETGGPLFTLAVWSIDLLRWLTGQEVTSVHAATKYTTLEKYGGTLGYDAAAVLQFSGGLVGCLQYSGSVTHSASTSRLEVVGDTTYLLDATHNDKVTLFAEDPYKTEWDVKQGGPRMWGHLQQDEYFVQCIIDGTPPSITPEDGRKAMEIALTIAQSQASA